uniref:Uncharacterized protein n=1 Tax=Rhizophora mucronata TaxID=61149 RepID=A0A2P2QF86_RHIMU
MFHTEITTSKPSIFESLFCCVHVLKVSTHQSISFEHYLTYGLTISLYTLHCDGIFNIGIFHAYMVNP